MAEQNIVYRSLTSHRVGRGILNSWKGDVERSGGLATNIGIHFFDMLIWLFRFLRRSKSEVHHSSPTRIGGHLELEQASVDWFLSVDRGDLPEEVRAQGKPTFRSIEIDGQELEFSENFTDLHSRVYEEDSWRAAGSELTTHGHRSSLPI